MTRFRNKIIWYWDYIDCQMYVVLAFRLYDKPGKIKLYFGSPKCIELSSLGEVLFNGKFSYENKTIDSVYLSQVLSRYFSRKRYIKSGELYVYDTKDKDID